MEAHTLLSTTTLLAEAETPAATAIAAGEARKRTSAECSLKALASCVREVRTTGGREIAADMNWWRPLREVAGGRRVRRETRTLARARGPAGEGVGFIG